jgi:hypothetical protein
MGCPIYGVLALTSTATDREGRSIPAPGRGILTTAREAAKFDAEGKRKQNRLLDVQVHFELRFLPFASLFINCLSVLGAILFSLSA